MINYEEYFSTPDQLADFLMLDYKEQLKFIAQQQSTTKSNLIMVCDLNKKEKRYA